MDQCLDAQLKQTSSGGNSTVDGYNFACFDEGEESWTGLEQSVSRLLGGGGGGPASPSLATLGQGYTHRKSEIL